jgi:hypothetical protein
MNLTDLDICAVRQGTLPLLLDALADFEARFAIVASWSAPEEPSRLASPGPKDEDDEDEDDEDEDDEDDEDDEEDKDEDDEDDELDEDDEGDDDEDNSDKEGGEPPTPTRRADAA